MTDAVLDDFVKLDRVRYSSLIQTLEENWHASLALLRCVALSGLLRMFRLLGWRYSEQANCPTSLRIVARHRSSGIDVAKRSSYRFVPTSVRVVLSA